MVRINLIDPKKLSDQHLIAEYNELLMLEGHVKKFPTCNDAPKEYCLGKGHIKFFKDKLLYLKKRHESLKNEMRRRGFKASKSPDFSKFPRSMKKSYSPDAKALSIIRKRLFQKLEKKDFYRYHGKKRSKSFFVNLLRN